MRLFVSLFCMLFAVFGQASVINLETDNFKTISRAYHDNLKGSDKTLLVFDIDDTLLTMTQDLGSVGWWDWQYALLKHESDSPYLFSKSMEGLLRIQNILFQLINMQVTDPDVVPFIQQESKQGATLLALTARDDEHENATESELMKNGFIDNEQLIFRKKGVKLFHQKSSSSGDIKCSALPRMIAYVHGVMYLAGQDKGEALRCVLDNTDKQFNKILFVDDTRTNHEAMIKAFENDPKRQVLNVFFIREHGKEQQFLHDSVRQAKAYDEWSHIKKALHENINDSVF